MSERLIVSDVRTPSDAYASIVAAFDATPVYVTRLQATVHGAPPDWLTRPMVRGDEFGPPIQSQADLAKATRGKR
jgi:hypothetical protein